MTKTSTNTIKETFKATKGLLSRSRNSRTVKRDDSSTTTTTPGKRISEKTNRTKRELTFTPPIPIAKERYLSRREQRPEAVAERNIKAEEKTTAITKTPSKPVSANSNRVKRERQVTPPVTVPKITCLSAPRRVNRAILPDKDTTPKRINCLPRRTPTRLSQLSQNAPEVTWRSNSPLQPRKLELAYDNEPTRLKVNKIVGILPNENASAVSELSTKPLTAVWTKTSSKILKGFETPTRRRIKPVRTKLQKWKPVLYKRRSDNDDTLTLLNAKLRNSYTKLKSKSESALSSIEDDDLEWEDDNLFADVSYDDKNPPLEQETEWEDSFNDVFLHRLTQEAENTHYSENKTNNSNAKPVENKPSSSTTNNLITVENRQKVTDQHQSSQEIRKIICSTEKRTIDSLEESEIKVDDWEEDDDFFTPNIPSANQTDDWEDDEFFTPEVLDVVDNVNVQNSSSGVVTTTKPENKAPSARCQYSPEEIAQKKAAAERKRRAKLATKILTVKKPNS